jgi:serine protease Do
VAGRFVKRALELAALALMSSACASSLEVSSRNEVIRLILPSTVQLRCEREGGGRRAASGVVLAADAEARRLWILTTRHFLEPIAKQDIFVTMPARKGRVKARVAALSGDSDLALLEVEGISLPPARLKESARLGDEVWIVTFPWGRRMTLVAGVVSQIGSEAGEALLEGPARMVDASVSYGASGGGVFDAATGALIGVVESYRTARVTTPGPPEQVLEIPVSGETTLISSEAILRFIERSGLDLLIQK